MKFSTQALLRQGKLEVLAKTEKMSSCKNSRKTDEQNEARFEAQCKPKASNSENGRFEERQ